MAIDIDPIIFADIIERVLRDASVSTYQV